MSSETQQLETRIDELEARVYELERQQGQQDWPETDDSLVFTDSFGPEDLLENAEERRSVRQAILDTIKHFESAYGEATPINYVHETLREDYDGERVLEEIDDLREQGEIYEPESDCVKVV